MCTKAEQQVGNLLVAEEPMLVNLLTELNVINTPVGQALITGYDQAATAVESFKPGTGAQEVIEVVQQADTAFNALAKDLPIPPIFTGLADIISAGLTAALSLVAGNSTPPTVTTSTSAVASAAILEAHQKQTLKTGLAAVETKTGYKPSHWEMGRAALGDTNVAANAIKSRWNKKVDELSDTSGTNYEHLKVA